MRLTRIAAVVVLLVPACVFAAPSKEMLALQALQRDVADSMNQMRELQKSMDEKMAAQNAKIEQLLQIAGQTNTGVSGINSGIVQTLQREMQGLKEGIAPVAALATKVENLVNDVSALRNDVSEQASRSNKAELLQTDILNRVKLLQPPPAPPPSDDPAAATPGVAASQPDAMTLYQNASRDSNDRVKADQAVDEFTEFLRLYPTHTSAAAAQFNIANIHYQQNKLDAAEKEFDNVIEVYPYDASVTPDAYYMKGMALKQNNRKTDAITTFRELKAKYPQSTAAVQATTQLNNLAAGTSTPKKPSPIRGKK